MEKSLAYVKAVYEAVDAVHQIIERSQRIHGGRFAPSFLAPYPPIGDYYSLTNVPDESGGSLGDLFVLSDLFVPSMMNMMRESYDRNKRIWVFIPNSMFKEDDVETFRYLIAKSEGREPELTQKLRVYLYGRDKINMGHIF